MQKVFWVISFTLILSVGNLVGGKLEKEGVKRLTTMLTASKVRKGLYRCPVTSCGKEYTTPEPGSMKHHLKTKHLEQYFKRLQCPQCPQTFTAMSSLNRHTLRVHEQSDLRPFKCSKCPQSFSRKDGRKIHYKRVHSNKNCPKKRSNARTPSLLKVTDYTSTESDFNDSLTETSSDKEPLPKRRKLSSQTSVHEALSFIQAHSEPEFPFPLQEASSSLTSARILPLTEDAEPQGSDTDSDYELPDLPF